MDFPCAAYHVKVEYMKSFYIAALTYILAAFWAQAALAQSVQELLQSAPSQMEEAERQESVRALDVEKLTDKQMEEMQRVYDMCSANYFNQRTTNCECYASKYIEKRVEMGDEAGHDVIALSLEGVCPNIEGQAGLTYDECIKRPPPISLKGKTHEEYCECVANTFATLYKQLEGRFDTKNPRPLRVRAMVSCIRGTPAGFIAP